MSSAADLEIETREKVEQFYEQVQSREPVQVDLVEEIIELFSDLQDSDSTISTAYLKETQQYFESVHSVRSVEAEEYGIDLGKANDIVIEFQMTVDEEDVNRR